MTRKEKYLNSDDLEDSADGGDDYVRHGLNAPKKSPMRRKNKFRPNEFETEKKKKNRNRHYRHSIRYEFDDLERKED